MKELKILYLYPDILELYGDYGNIQVLRYRLEQRGFQSTIEPYSIGDTPPDFKSYDLIFSGRRCRSRTRNSSRRFSSIQRFYPRSHRSWYLFLINLWFLSVIW